MTSAPAAPVRTRKPRGLGHERRPEILAAAKALFVEDGYGAFTTRKLAARVGLSQTGLYVHFRNREEIFDELTRQTFQQMAEVFRRAEAAGGEGFGRLTSLARAYIAFGLEHPDEYRLTFMEGPGLHKAGMAFDVDRPFEQQGAGGQVFLMIRANLQRLAAEGELRPLDLTAATHTVWFALHGLVSTFIARPNFLKTERATLVDALIDTLVQGLRRPAS